MCRVAQNHMGRGDDTPPGLRVARNRNGRRALTTQESHGFSRVECQFIPSFVIRTHGIKPGVVFPHYIMQETNATAFLPQPQLLPRIIPDPVRPQTSRCPLPNSILSTLGAFPVDERVGSFNQSITGKDCKWSLHFPNLSTPLIVVIPLAAFLHPMMPGGSISKTQNNIL
jgi:hypothetical protein